MKPPSYLQHRPTGQAYVRIAEKFHYLGKYGTPESHQNYHRLVAEWSANGGVLANKGTATTVAEVAAAFLKRSRSYNYHKDAFCRVTRAMAGLMPYADTPAIDFGPIRLKTIRETWVKEGLGRDYVNALTNLVKAAFRNAVAIELTPPGVLTRLEAIENLKQGRCQATEGKKRHPVPFATLEKTCEHLGSIPRAIVQLIWTSGARPGELCILRPCDIDRTGPVWLYLPQRHKNTHHGHARTIYFGPASQAILAPFLNRPAHLYCFCPKEAQFESYEANRLKKTGIILIGGTKPYKESALRHTVARAALRAKLDIWTPHQARHSAGTRFREHVGLQTTKTLLGHATIKATEIYAEQDQAQAIAAALKLA